MRSAVACTQCGAMSANSCSCFARPVGAGDGNTYVVNDYGRGYRDGFNACNAMWERKLDEVKLAEIIGDEMLLHPTVEDRAIYCAQAIIKHLKEASLQDATNLTCETIKSGE